MPKELPRQHGRLEFLKRWGPAIFWMVWIFSASTDLMSHPHTSRIIEPLLRWLIPGISPENLEAIHFGIRKAGHLSEYAILSILFWRGCGWRWPRESANRRLLRALMLSILYSATDEFHQLFVPSRAASPLDVLIDGVGAAIGLLIVLALTRTRFSRRFPFAASRIHDK